MSIDIGVYTHVFEDVKCKDDAEKSP